MKIVDLNKYNNIQILSRNEYKKSIVIIYEFLFLFWYSQSIFQRYNIFSHELLSHWHHQEVGLVILIFRGSWISSLTVIHRLDASSRYDFLFLFCFSFFFYWPRYVPEIGVPFIEGKIKDILWRTREKYRVNSLIESRSRISSPSVKKKRKSTRILFTIYWPNFSNRLSTNSSAIRMIVSQRVH